MQHNGVPCRVACVWSTERGALHALLVGRLSVEIWCGRLVPVRLLSLMDGGGSHSSSPSAFTVAGAAGAAVSLVCCASGLTVQWTPEREPQTAPLLVSELMIPEPGAAAESYTRRVGALGSGNDATPPEPGHTLASAVARCAAIGAVGFTFCGRLTTHETDTTTTLPLCYFKTTAAGSCSS